MQDSTVLVHNPTSNVITVNSIDVAYVQSSGEQTGSEEINPLAGLAGTDLVMAPNSTAKVTMGADVVFLDGSWSSECNVIDINWLPGDDE
jgi:hypothetical protein